MRAIIGQQISVAAATTITGRVATRWGEPLADGKYVVFPRPETLVDADLASIGVPRVRGETLRQLARAVASGALSLEPGADPRAVREALLAIPGIGEWTAQYVALRALGEPDAFPASDLGLLRSPASGRRQEPAPAARARRGVAAVARLRRDRALARLLREWCYHSRSKRRMAPRTAREPPPERTRRRDDGL